MTQLSLPLETDSVVIFYANLLVYTRRAYHVAYYWLQPNRRRAQRLKSKRKSRTWREHSRGWA